MKQIRKTILMFGIWALAVAGLAVASPDSAEAATVKKLKVSSSTGVKTVYIGGASEYRYTTLKVSVTPKNASKKVTYQSSKPKVATVSSSGKVKGLKTGSTTITVRSKTNTKVKATIKITVKKYTKRVRPKSLSASISGKSIASGKTVKIKATIKPATTTNKTLKYKSYNTQLATVNSKGVVTANKNGKAGKVKIRVYAADKNKNGKTLYKDFTVEIKPVLATSVKLYNRVMTTGTTSTLNASITPANTTNRQLTWSSDNPAVVTVNQSGKITAKSAGIAKITAKSSNGKTANCQITVNRKWISIHDPSITQDTDGTYYLFGTHLAAGKSTDLMSWTDIGGVSKLFGTTEAGFVSKMSNIYSWMNISEDSKKDYTYTWAPSVIYNKTTKKYYYYACTSEFGSTDSVIWFATADKITGPYSKATPIVYSGFINDTNANNVWSYKRTNIPALITNGTLSGVGNWFNSSGGYNSAPGGMPNAIDPALFYDENGKLWMVYGSFSGGIYLLEIDQTTGMPKYPAKDDPANHVVSYFGKRLTTSEGNGGNGEGPYIIYDKASGYYYLFITYGGLAAPDGYNTRVFRSKTVDGDYEDASGISGNDAVNKGLKLFDNYKFASNEQGYLSGGHSSSLVDKDGKLFHIYHTRFNDGVGSDHQVRVHQMFTSQNGWLVMMPYEYNGETISKTGYSGAEIVGTYSFINHGNTTVTAPNMASANSIIKKPVTISLNGDRTISGAVSGTWSASLGENPYVTMVIDGVTYEGVFCYQYDESNQRKKTMTFALAGENNCTVWGSKNTVSDTAAVTTTVSNLTKLFTNTGNKVYGNLPVSGLNGSKITWSSSSSAISSTGKVTRGEKDITGVTLTATITKVNAKTTKTFSGITIPKKATASVNEKGQMAVYTFDNSGNAGADTSGNNLAAEINGAVYQASYAGRNGVLKFDGIDDYVKLPQSLVKTDEMTFAAWVYSETTAWWPRIVDLGDGEANSIFLTTVGDASGVYRFDMTTQDTGVQMDAGFAVPAWKWNHVAFTICADGSGKLYLNGKTVAGLPAGSLKFRPDDFNGTQNYLGKSQYSVDPYFKGYMDEVCFYGKALTQSEIKALMK